MCGGLDSRRKGPQDIRLLSNHITVPDLTPSPVATARSLLSSARTPTGTIY